VRSSSSGTSCSSPRGELSERFYTEVSRATDAARRDTPPDDVSSLSEPPIDFAIVSLGVVPPDSPANSPGVPRRFQGRRLYR